jgi:hypothetical protein
MDTAFFSRSVRFISETLQRVSMKLGFDIYNIYYYYYYYCCHVYGVGVTNNNGFWIR